MVSFIFILAFLGTITNFFAATMKFQFTVLIAAFTSLLVWRSEEPFLSFCRVNDFHNEKLILLDIQCIHFYFRLACIFWIPLNIFADTWDNIWTINWWALYFDMPIDLLNADIFGAFPDANFIVFFQFVILFYLIDEILEARFTR